MLKTDMPSPFENEQWVRNMLATRAITPPRGEMPGDERRYHVFLFGFLLLLGLFFWIGVGFR